MSSREGIESQANSDAVDVGSLLSCFKGDQKSKAANKPKGNKGDGRAHQETETDKVPKADEALEGDEEATANKEIEEIRGLKLSYDIPPYKMTHQKRGKCVIFNIMNFNNGDHRSGSEKDVERLTSLFSKLKFDVTVHTDLRAKPILSVLKQEAEADHTNSDCFVCCILTHGNEGILKGTDGRFRIGKLFEPFQGDKCLTLLDKPKLFFIQACQGKKKDAGAQIDFGADGNSGCKIPIEADFLVAYSTVPGYLAWRNEENGAWFIQVLCAVINECYKSLHLVDMLQIVSYNVSECFESRHKKPQLSGKKQIPYFTSTLRKKVYFLP